MARSQSRSPRHRASGELARLAEIAPGRYVRVAGRDAGQCDACHHRFVSGLRYGPGQHRLCTVCCHIDALADEVRAQPQLPHSDRSTVITLLAAAIHAAQAARDREPPPDEEFARGPLTEGGASATSTSISLLRAAGALLPAQGQGEPAASSPGGQFQGHGASGVAGALLPALWQWRPRAPGFVTAPVLAPLPQLPRNRDVRVIITLRAPWIRASRHSSGRGVGD